MTNSLSNHVPGRHDHPRHRRHHHLGHAAGRQGVRRADRAVRQGQARRSGLPWKGQGDTAKLWADLLDCVKTRQQPKCNIGMAVRVQAPLSMGILSHRENKVAIFDAETQSIVL